MRRASSRARIVPMDTFSTTASFVDIDQLSDTESDYATCFEYRCTSPTMKRSASRLSLTEGSFNFYEDGHQDGYPGWNNNSQHHPSSSSSGALPGVIVWKKRNHVITEGPSLNDVSTPPPYSFLTPTQSPVEPSDHDYNEEASSDGVGDNIFLSSTPNTTDESGLLIPTTVEPISPTGVFEFANVSSTNSHRENNSSNKTQISSFGSLLRYGTRRGRSTLNLQPNVTTLADDASDLREICRPSPTFLDIIEDVQLLILSYLTACQLRKVAITCKKNLDHCYSYRLWFDLCAKRWPLLQTICDSKSSNECHIHFRDDYGIPLALTQSHTCDEFTGEVVSTVNLSVLHGISQPNPIGISQEYFQKSVPLQSQEVHSKEFRALEIMGSTKSNPKPHNTSVLQFTRPVGSGDRSIRSSNPFPHIHAHNCYKWSSGGLCSVLLRGGRGTFGPRACAADSTSTPLGGLICFASKPKLFGVTTIRPFVSPFVSKMEYSSGKLSEVEVNVTPRLVTYYEISLMQRTANEESEDHPTNTTSRQILQNVMDNFNDGRQPNNRTTSDCVAIGLAQESFDTNEKMPGWDKTSYGYHGDDGGIFHASGDMVSEYGPVFSAGDTVGCGLDYTNKGIFFTLNGEFLGYAWTGIDLNVPYYPTVGIDTNTPIEVNFGEFPFVFDLTFFIDQHRPLIDYMFRDGKAYVKEEHVGYW